MTELTVMMPVYNREKYVREAINSILCQSFTDFRLLIYNDGSTDKTQDILFEFGLDSRCFFIGESENHGVAYARNRMLAACETKYACLQDSDDISEPTRLEKQFKVVKASMNSMVFCGWKPFGDPFLPKNLKKMPQAHATLMFPVDKEIGFNEKLLSGEDWDWIKRMQDRYITLEMSEVLYKVRSHPDRIGVWKRKFERIPPEVRDKLSYGELVEYYKQHFGG